MRHAVLAAILLLAARTGVAAEPAQRILTFDDRVAAQKAIEQVYWNHRLWPKENRALKPPLSAVISDETMRAKVEDYLEKSNALETIWRRPITADQLQAEMDRMARGSRDPRVLQELFDALHGDAFLIAETLARPLLVERLARNWFAGDDRIRGTSGPKPSFEAWWTSERARQSTGVESSPRPFVLPALVSTACTNDTWSPTFTDLPDGRYMHTAVWTGTEMIVWGGWGDGAYVNTGGRYNPATDTWSATSTGAHVPSPRYLHAAIWTGTEMIVWGGRNNLGEGPTPPYLNSGGRYDPIGDSWLPTSTGANAAAGRVSHTAVWTGTEMIVWGGAWNDPSNLRIAGGRYNPVTDSWLPTSTGANVPTGRTSHTAVWTGTEMIVWGGLDYWTGSEMNSGARYDPSANSWTPTSTGVNVPAGRVDHSAVWTGTEMIVWGGSTYSSPDQYLNSGGRYNPSTNSWVATSAGAGAPSPRSKHSAFWTGSKMIVWGGNGAGPLPLATGALYEPATDSWTATPASPLQPRNAYAAVWTGSEMIIWGGQVGNTYFNTGGRYDPSSGSWVATSNATNVAGGRYQHTALWTGTEMIVWGGIPASSVTTDVPAQGSGSRYAPATDSWLPTSMTGDIPAPRRRHSAVWTGTEMIVWGGYDATALNTGGRYNPVTDVWMPTSIGANAPTPRAGHAAVWTGTQMIVWGSDPSGGRYDPATNTWATISTGTNAPFGAASQTAVWTGATMIFWSAAGGGRYDPSIDAWTSISTGTNVPLGRLEYTAVWTGTEMIIWGGSIVSPASGDTNTGARYDPVSDSWTPTSTATNVPSARKDHTAVWTGSEMVVWSGNYSSAGGRYNPVTDGWLPTSTGANVPTGRAYHTAVWTGAEMIVWGGAPDTRTGGRYCACPSGRLVYRDADGDGFGDPGRSIASCDGTAPAGYALDPTDCNDANASVHAGAPEICDGIDDNCDGHIDEDALGVDSDDDGLHNCCDDCVLDWNPNQTDSDHNGVGDACDLDDGLIYVYSTDVNYRKWQSESGYTSWNSYRGSLAVLRTTGQYTQAPGSNPLAARDCGVSDPYVFDPLVPSPSEVAFNLVTGVAGGDESSLGTNSAGVPRANANPCP